MGRIKSTAIKTLGNELVAKHSEKFATDFGKNKKSLAEIKEFKSKRTRNIVAGFITKRMQAKNAGESEE